MKPDRKKYFLDKYGVDVEQMVFKEVVAEIKGIDDKEQTITAFVNTGGRDRMNEVVDIGGVDLRNFKKNPVVMWAHKYGDLPIAKALWIKKDEGGLLSKMKFAARSNHICGWSVPGQPGPFSPC